MLRFKLGGQQPDGYILFKISPSVCAISHTCTSKCLYTYMYTHTQDCGLWAITLSNRNIGLTSECIKFPVRQGGQGGSRQLQEREVKLLGQCWDGKEDQIPPSVHLSSAESWETADAFRRIKSPGEKASNTQITRSCFHSRVFCAEQERRRHYLDGVCERLHISFLLWWQICISSPNKAWPRTIKGHVGKTAKWFIYSSESCLHNL